MQKRFITAALIILSLLYPLSAVTSNVYAQTETENETDIEDGVETDTESGANTDTGTESNANTDAGIGAESDAASEPPSVDPPLVDPPLVEAESVTLMDAETGIVLYRKEQDEINYPASVTKVMTALLTLELCDDLNERIVFSRNAVFSLPRDASHIAMDEGETLTVYDALHGLLLASANEVANALAEYLAGSVDNFAALMNKRAAALGAVNTNFVNPSGLFDDDHQTTAYDMALIMREATKHELFNEIIAKRRYDIQPTEKQPEVRELLNSNRLIQPGDYFNEWVVGSKTGYTDEAMHTLVTFAEKDGRSLIVSAMRGTRDGIFTDTANLLDYGFGIPYSEQEIFDNEAYLRTVPVFAEENGERVNVGQVTAKSGENLTFDLPEDFDLAEVRYELDLPKELDAPVLFGDEIGTVTCYIQDVKVGEANLNALNAVYAPVVETAANGAAQGDAEAETDAAPSQVTDGDSVEVFGSDVTPVTEKSASGSIADVPFWEYDYFTTLAIPIGLTLFMLIVSFMVFLRRRKRKNRKVFTYGRYGKFSGDGFYRYK